MVGGTTANDSATASSKVMKQEVRYKQKQPQRQKQNPLGKGKEGRRYMSLWTACPEPCIRPLRESLTVS